MGCWQLERQLTAHATSPEHSATARRAVGMGAREIQENHCRAGRIEWGLGSLGGMPGEGRQQFAA